MENNGHFELVRSNRLNVAYDYLPILVDENGRSLPETKLLLHVADIVGSTLNREGFMSLVEIVDEVGSILTNPNKKEGLLIEDEESASSVNIVRNKSKIKLAGSGVFEISTELLFNTLYQWNELLSEQAQGLPNNK